MIPWQNRVSWGMPACGVATLTLGNDDGVWWCQVIVVKVPMRSVASPKGHTCTLVFVLLYTCHVIWTLGRVW